MADIAGKTVGAEDELTPSGHRAAHPRADRYVKDVLAFAADSETLLAKGHGLDIVQDGDAKGEQLLEPLPQSQASETCERVSGGREDASLSVDGPGGRHTDALDLYSFISRTLLEFANKLPDPREHGTHALRSRGRY